MLYDYRCARCSATTEAYNRIDDRKTNAPECCGQKMEIVHLSAPYGYVEMEIRYRCPVTNEGVTSKRQRVNIMAKHNLVDANDLVNEKTIARSTKRWEETKALAEKHKPPDYMRREVDKHVASIVGA